jgi:hypothetical protein
MFMTTDWLRSSWYLDLKMPIEGKNIHTQVSNRKHEATIP